MQLWVNSTQASCMVHAVIGGDDAWSADSSSWLFCSAWPLVWGWKPDDKLTFMPIAEQISFQTWGPRSERMSRRIPWRQKMRSVRSWTMSSAVEGLGWAPKCASFEKRFTMVSITVFQLEGLRPVTQLRVMWDQGCPGVGKCLSRPAGGKLEDLFCAQIEQEEKYSLASFISVGHQKRCYRKVKV